MSGKARHRQGAKPGQPLWVFAMVLGGWVLARSLSWQVPFPLDDLTRPALPPGMGSAAAPATGGTQSSPQTPAMPADAPQDRTDDAPGSTMEDWYSPPQDWTPSAPRWTTSDDEEARFSFAADGSAAFAPASARAAAGHTMLMAAGFSNLRVPDRLLPYLVTDEGTGVTRGPDGQAVRLAEAAPFLVPFASAQTTQGRRWSADGWVLWRKDTTTPILTGRPSYGRSQAGAVARFDLRPSSNMRPQAFVRATTTLAGRRDVEGALGLSARPLGRVPVRVAAELRLADRPEGSELRPAVYAVTELPPVSLASGFEAEVYMQGGYVGGIYATAFVEGQARIDRSIMDEGQFDLRAGGGAWGGAQKDARRLDVGPSASLRFPIGDARGRLAADYRVRVAGDAQPSSGPALTLSAGF